MYGIGIRESHFFSIPRKGRDPMKKRYLILEDGTIFQGWAFGADETVIGELVFTTLTKEGMPLLRYRTKDLCSIMEGECPCGRTNVRISRIMGRSDDMLIIRGINVFPSQVESVILGMPEFEPHYQLIVDRINNLDTLQVLAEVRKEYLSDEISGMLALKKRLADKLKSVLTVSVDVKLVEPNSIERSSGKSQRVIDKRIMK